MLAEKEAASIFSLREDRRIRDQEAQYHRYQARRRHYRHKQHFAPNDDGNPATTAAEAAQGALGNGPIKKESKRFFFEKKKQKTFDPWPLRLTG